jgi:hypothetical protein
VWERPTQSTLNALTAGLLLKPAPAEGSPAAEQGSAFSFRNNDPKSSRSDLPSLRLFGWLSAFAMLAAVSADLLILRPTVTFLRRLSVSCPQRHTISPEPAE